MKRVLVCALSVMTLLVGANSAYANQQWTPGSVCRGNAVWEQGYISFLDSRAYNDYQAGTIGISCPVQVTDAVSSNYYPYYRVNEVSVMYYDATPTNGGGAVFCWVVGTSATGGTTASSSVYSCSTTGGCGNDANTFTGTGRLDFANPLAYGYWAGLSVRCGVPYNDSEAYGKSSLISIFSDWTN
ncbi:MAG: hypothetical protein WC683_10505 [bacterium]